MKKILILITIFLVVASCGDNSDRGPETIYYGEDVCERCQMIISDQKFAAQYITPSGKASKFDDTGCMIEFIINNEKISDNKFNIFVIDYTTGHWINARQSYFSYSKSVKTPMNYGIIAFGNRRSAEEFSEKTDSSFIGGYSDVKQFLKKK